MACGLVTTLIYFSIIQVLNGSNSPPFFITLPIYATIGILLGLIIAFVFSSLNSIFAGALGPLILHIGCLLAVIFALDVTLQVWFTAVYLVVVTVVGAISGAAYKFASR